MIDSHLHLDDEKFFGIVDDVVADMQNNGVALAINNSCNFESMQQSILLAEHYPQIFATVGMHPHDSKFFDQAFADYMTSHAKHPKVVAVGEIGLDYYYDLSDRNIQKDVFAFQIELAGKLGLPITLHVRDAYGDAWDILRSRKQHLTNGVLWHCYSGSAEFARQMAKEGHYFAFGGAITFKNANKQEVIDQVPMDKVLTETDSPYMAPVPLRGKVNTPSNIPLVLAKLAQMYNVDKDVLQQQIHANTLTLFPKIAKFLGK